MKSIIVTTNELVEILDISRAWIGTLEKEGVLKKESRGTWNAVINMQAFVKYVKENETAPKEAVDYWTEKAEHESLKKELTKIELQKKQDEIIEVDEVTKGMVNLVLTIRNRLLSLHARIAPKVIGLKNVREVSEAVRMEIESALIELSQENAEKICCPDIDKV